MNFWRELFDPDEPESYGQRVQFLAVELVVLLRGQWELWTWAPVISHQPGIPKPTALARYVDVSFMLQAPAAQLNALLCGGLMLAGLLGRWRGAYLLAFLSFHLQYVARFGLGKVQHGSNMLGMALLSLALAHLAYRDPALRRKAGLGLIVILFSAGYLSAATSKLSLRGLGWVNGHHLWLWIREKGIDGLAEGGAARFNTLQRWALGNVTLATLLLSGGLATELSAALMWWRPARRWVMFALAGMHLGITYTMNIYFTGSVLLLLALSLPLAEAVDRLRASKWGARWP